MTFPNQAFLLHNSGYIKSLKQSWIIAFYNMWEYNWLSMAFFPVYLVSLLGLFFVPFVIAALTNNILLYTFLSLMSISTIFGFLHMYHVAVDTMFYINRMNLE